VAAVPDCLAICLAMSRLSSCRKVWSALQAGLLLLLVVGIVDREEGRGGKGKVEAQAAAAAGSNKAAAGVLVSCRRASCSSKAVPKEPRETSSSSSGASWGRAAAANMAAGLGEVGIVLWW